VDVPLDTGTRRRTAGQPGRVPLMSESVSSGGGEVMRRDRGLFYVLKWTAILAGVGIAVHFALQAIIHDGAELQKAAASSSRTTLLEELASSDPELARRVRAGMAQYESTCRLCHHRTGHGGRFTPSLAGKSPEVIALMLRLYREGQEIGPLTALMAPWAADLTDKEIENLAEYIATL
jgi:cytochrome c